MPKGKKKADRNSGSEPKLLSGGNPQIPKGEGDEPVQAYIAAMPGWKRSLGERLDGLIVRAVPDVHKAVKWNQPFYGHEGRAGSSPSGATRSTCSLGSSEGPRLIPFRPRRPVTPTGVTSTSTKTTTSTRASSSRGSNRQATCPARRCRAATALEGRPTYLPSYQRFRAR
jgi:hypothetical protein